MEEVTESTEKRKPKQNDTRLSTNNEAWCYSLCARTVPSAPKIVIPRARAHGT